MALGYCPVCNELRTIRKAPVRFPGQREAWAMAEHDKPRRGCDLECVSWLNEDCNCGADRDTERCPGVGKHV